MSELTIPCTFRTINYHGYCNSCYDVNQSKSGCRHNFVMFLWQALIICLLLLHHNSVDFVKLSCTGLELMAMNTNPDLLSDCERDDPCSRMTCQTAGVITSQLDSVIIHLEPCEAPPGITIQLVKDNEVIINELITSPTIVTHNLGIATVEAHVFVNSTDSSIGISVGLFTIHTHLPRYVALLHDKGGLGRLPESPTKKKTVGPIRSATIVIVSLLTQLFAILFFAPVLI